MNNFSSLSDPYLKFLGMWNNTCVHKYAFPKEKELYRAVLTGDLNKVKLLLDNCIDINKIYSNDMTLLLYAIELGNLEIIRLLLDRNADINVKYQNMNILQYACQDRFEYSPQLIYLLIKRGIGIDTLTDDEKDKLLASAIKYCNNYFFNLLIPNIYLMKPFNYVKK